jgi:UDP-glucose 4-epimerase
MAKTRVLITGGFGYIGSHTVVALCQEGYEPIIVDNLSNSSKKVAERLKQLTGQSIPYEIFDVRETDKVERVIEKYKPEAVIHFAALKSVHESVKKPLEYYSNNVGGTMSVLSAMQAQGVHKIIFSSSATVYGPIDKPATEDMQLGETTNPYGSTKAQCERILKDMHSAYDTWSITTLRYFNPIGAHQSGLLGESPHDVPNNLMPYITQVAIGKLKELKVYGDDYPTPDGTCIRDYIHVQDLARGHVAALKKLKPGLAIYNLGTGKGSSVKEIIDVFQRVTGQTITHKITDRRPGDLAQVTADPTKAYKQLGWKTELTLEDMCRDAWNWQAKNPDGY